jgi:multisubunit Na+/H+ antiporter MnhF subunit
MMKSWERNEVIQLLSLSGTLAGLCITALTVFKTLIKSFVSVTIADDVLAVSALSFLVATYLFFFSLRVKENGLGSIFEKLGDLFFLFGLSGMVSSGFVMVYTIW